MLSLLISINVQASSKSEDIPLEIQSLYYKKGYKEAGEKYYKKGYEDAVKDLMGQLKKFETRHNAIEATKYLSSTGKISNAEVVKIRDGNGGYQIKILPPKIEKAFTVYDLFMVPENYNNINIKDDETKNNSESMLSETSSKIYEKAFFGQGESIANKDQLKIVNAKELNKETLAEFKKNKDNREILEASNLSYTETANSYKVFFMSKQEKNTFCNGIGVKICN